MIKINGYNYRRVKDDKPIGIGALYRYSRVRKGHYYSILPTETQQNLEQLMLTCGPVEVFRLVNKFPNFK